MHRQATGWTDRVKALMALGAGLVLIGLGALSQSRTASGTQGMAAVPPPSAETAAINTTIDTTRAVTANRDAAKGPAVDRQTEQAQTVAPSAPQYKVDEYTIQSGDSMWTVAEHFHTDVNSIMSLNPDVRESELQLNAKLYVPSFKGTVHKVGSGDTLSGLAGLYSLKVEDITSANKLASGDTIAIGQKLYLPGAKVPDPVMTASRGGNRITSGLPGLVAWPTTGPITSSFGPRWGTIHTGIDIGVPVGTPIRAGGGGTVVQAGWDGGYGNSIIVEHPSGVQTRYAHLSVMQVALGDRVDRGDQIALSGNTGHSTGPHLHFEVIVGGRPVDPMNYLP